MDHLTVAFVLFPKVAQLDQTGPAQVLSRLGNATIELVVRSLDAVPTDAGFLIVPTTTFDRCAAPDIVCVPGGSGADDAMEDEAILSWLRTVSETAKWTISVCTGSLVPGAAGSLKGCRDTSHWLSRELLGNLGAIPIAQRVVIDGHIVTGGGVTAGIDFALSLVAAIRGPDQAKLVQLSLEYDPEPPFGSGFPEDADPLVLATFEGMAAKAQALREERV